MFTPRIPLETLDGYPEEWRVVAEWDGEYLVSNYGRVANSFGRIFKPKIVTSGHVTARFKLDGKPVLRRVHRLVLEAFVGPCPPGMEGCHNNGDPTDNRLANLRWDTRRSNVLDSVRHGTHPQTRKTECPEGHAYTPENTQVNAKGQRHCRTCRLAQSRANYSPEKRRARFERTGK